MEFKTAIFLALVLVNTAFACDSGQILDKRNGRCVYSDCHCSVKPENRVEVKYNGNCLKECEEAGGCWSTQYKPNCFKKSINLGPYTVIKIGTEDGASTVIVETDSGVVGQNIVVTSAFYKYVDSGLDLTWRDSLVFEVQAPHSVHLALSKLKDQYSGNIYELILGGWKNTRAIIRICRQCSDVAQNIIIGDVLNGSALDYYWASWKNGTIKLGRGFVPNQNVLVQYTHPKPYLVKYAAFSTWTGSTGTFVVQRGTSGADCSSAALASRVDAGWIGITEKECLCRDACWDACGYPMCFYPN